MCIIYTTKPHSIIVKQLWISTNYIAQNTKITDCEYANKISTSFGFCDIRNYLSLGKCKLLLLLLLLVFNNFNCLKQK